jgi:UPF0271 protein
MAPVVAAWLDLNADLGESFGRWVLGDDEALLAVVTSANIACGFHAGDPQVLRRSCEGAARHGVRIGAQVSYRDLAGFGRRFMDVSHDELRDDVLYQIGALDAFARVAGTRVSYLKPHGALYNAAVTLEEQATAIVDAVAEYDRSLPVLGLPGSALLRAAQGAGLRAVTEAFADRRYTSAGTLVSRRQPGSVLTDPAAIRAQVRQLIVEGTVQSQEGDSVPMNAESICVHGDTPSAVAIAITVKKEIEDAGCAVRAFMDEPA